jgi:hypothetical protein
MRPFGARGAVLLVVLITLLMMMALIGAVLSLASNQAVATSQVTNRYVRNYFRAHAGVVDARERIRLNDTSGLGGATDFEDPTYDPPAYFIDLYNDSMHTGAQASGDDVRVDIGPEDPSTGLRSVVATGLE